MIKLNTQQRRQMRIAAERVDRVTQADRRFFERFPDRQHRVRLTSAAELEQQTILDGKPPFIPDGCRCFTLIRNIAPGARMRLFWTAPADAETDLSEEIARAIYERAATPQARRIAAQILENAGARS